MRHGRKDVKHAASQPASHRQMYVCMQKKTRAHTLENKLKTDLDTEHEHKGTPSSIVIGDARQKFQAERTRDWILSLILDSKHSQIISVYHQQLSIFCMGAYCAVYSSRSNRIRSDRIGCVQSVKQKQLCTSSLRSVTQLEVENVKNAQSHSLSLHVCYGGVCK